MKFRNVVKMLKDLNAGQGHASISCDWDSATSEPVFSLTVYRERDGETIEKQKLSEDEFLVLLNKAVKQ